MAARGVTVMQSNTTGISQQQNFTGGDLARFAKQLAGAGGQTSGVASKDASGDSTSQVSANNKQAEKASKAIDTNNSHITSHSELLNALSKTVTSLSADATQALLNLINTNGDANINSAQLTKFETAFVETKKSGK